MITLIHEDFKEIDRRGTFKNCLPIDLLGLMEIKRKLMEKRRFKRYGSYVSYFNV